MYRHHYAVCCAFRGAGPAEGSRRREALRLSDDSRAPQPANGNLTTFAAVHNDRGDRAAAFDLHRSTGHLAGEAHTPHLLGHLEPDHARTHWRSALDLFTRMQSPEAAAPRALV